MPSVDTHRYRDGMAQLGAAVTVITTGGPAGRAGLTATAVTSVTDQPPTLLVCVNRGAHTHDIIAANGVLCVNPLSADQEEVSRLFSSRDVTMAERFERVDWVVLSTGSPVLTGALVGFDCRVTASHDIGTHTVFYAEVVDMRLGKGGAGLAYFNRAYHRLEDRSF